MSSVRIYRSLQEVGPDFGPSALTIGNFDGVHIGHREIFRRVAKLASEGGWKPAALTFDPHPATIVAPERAPRLLSTPLERCERMAEEGIRQALVLPFTPEFSWLDPEEFCRRILAGVLQVKAVLIGSNFRFGRNQAGDPEALARFGARYGFLVDVVGGVVCRGRMVSSSEVRRLLRKGDVSLANRLLGRPYAVSGAVVSGAGVGSRLTVPTLNLRTEAGFLPATGVYITRTGETRGRTWPSVTNIGYRPTFHGENLTIETHLLEPVDGCTPQHIRVAFLRRLREEREFPDPEALKRQILQDAMRARSYFRRTAEWVRHQTSGAG